MNKEYKIKRFVSYTCAILVASFAAHFYAQAEKFWVALAAIIVMQTAVGVSVRQGILRYIWMIAAIFAGTFFVTSLQNYPIALDLMTAFVLVISCYSTMKYSFRRFILSVPFLFSLIFLITILLPISQPPILYMRLWEITLGAAIGIIANLVVFPRRVDVEFRKNIIPVLNAYAAYLAAIIDLLFKKENAAVDAQKKKIAVENSLQAQSAFFPVWVYERGLSVVYQQGHRHFLIMIERVGQILFSMHHIARHQFDPLLLQDLRLPLDNFVKQAEVIFTALTTVMNLNKLTEGVSDLSEEMVELENTFKSIAPSLELIDMSQDYTLCAALIADLKDLRVALIRLGEALRGAAR